MRFTRQYPAFSPASGARTQALARLRHFPGIADYRHHHYSISGGQRASKDCREFVKIRRNGQKPFLELSLRAKSVPHLSRFGETLGGFHPHPPNPEPVPTPPSSFARIARTDVSICALFPIGSCTRAAAQKWILHKRCSCEGRRAFALFCASIWRVHAL